MIIEKKIFPVKVDIHLTIKSTYSCRLRYPKFINWKAFLSTENHCNKSNITFLSLLYLIVLIKRTIKIKKKKKGRSWWYVIHVMRFAIKLMLPFHVYVRFHKKKMFVSWWKSIEFENREDVLSRYAFAFYIAWRSWKKICPSSEIFVTPFLCSSNLKIN